MVKKSAKKKSELLNINKKVGKTLEKTQIFSTEGIVWTPQMSINENTIDKQHQKLIAQINKLMKYSSYDGIREIRTTLDFLKKYVKEHFSYEENYMKKIGYPKKDLEIHKKIHSKFIDFFKGFEKEFYGASNEKHLTQDKFFKLNDKAKRYLGDWLIDHIMKVDHKYCKYDLIGNKDNTLLLNSKKKEKYSDFKKDPKSLDMSAMKLEIQKELKEQMTPSGSISSSKSKKKPNKEYIKTGISGFDELFENGIPQGNNVLVAGGAGSGKTILCLQTLINKANEGKKCIYLTLEEREEKLIQHMEDFGWNAKELVKKGKLKIVRINPFDITRNVDAMLAKQRGELLIDIDPVLLPTDFNPDFIAIDSLTAIASAFNSKEDSYRIYIEQLFRFLEKLGATTFLITETEQVPKIYSTTGVEEFLADGVIVLYNLKHGDVRENAIEVLKMRGEKHQKKIVAMIVGDNGVTVYPDQEVFSEI